MVVIHSSPEEDKLILSPGSTIKIRRVLPIQPSLLVRDIGHDAADAER